MQLSLSEFKLYIDATILKRGLSYFKRGVLTAFYTILTVTVKLLFLERKQ